ncbi:MAG: UPF0280 family protein [Methanosphaera sp.]|nr:UPF0280 family protein [Methanosphaera sp.]
MTRNIYTKNIDIESTHIHLKSDINMDVKPIIREQYRTINSTINRNPSFTGFEPVDIESDDHIISLMINAGCIGDTGPMAAVAGSMSQVVLDELLKQNSKYSIIENGGDIAMKINKNTIICIYAGRDNPFSYNYGFKLKPRTSCYGICTSSSDGPSKSFGISDATIVFSSQASISDALATGIGNHANGVDKQDVIHNALSYAEDYDDYFDGVLIIKDDVLGKTGHIPKIVEVNGSISEDYDIE